MTPVDRAPDKALAAELRANAERRLKAFCAAGQVVCEALHAPYYQLISPGGATLAKDEYLGQIADGSLHYRRFEPEGDIVVLVLGPSAVALRYRAAIDAVFPAGHDVDRFWHTDIY